MRWAIILVFLSVSLFAKAQPVHVLKESEGISIIGKKMMVFDDETASLSFNDIQKPATQKKFKQAVAEIINMNVTHSVIWVKIKICTSEKREWYMETGMSSMERVDLYQLHHGKIIHQRTGIKVPRSERVLIGHRNIFRLNTTAGDTLDCYIRYQDSAPLKITIKTGTLKQFFEHDHTANYLHGAYLGIVVMMVLYNLFLYVTNRHKVYLYYILYVIFSAMFILFFTGHVVLFPDWYIAIFSFSPVLIAAAFGAFGLLFTMEFLITRQYAPVLHRVMIYFIALISIPIVISLLGYKHLSINIIQLAGFMLAFLSIATSIVVYRRGYKPAKYYILGFGAYMAGLMMLIVSNLVGFTDEYMAVYSLEAGSGIEAIFLSFAIGDKLNTANKDKNAAKEQAMKAALENEKLVREQNTMLEHKVNERTKELKEQKEIVEEKQKEIVDSINYAKRIQDAYLPPTHVLTYFFPSSFLIFKPKDIVSGDFYWYYTKRNEDGKPSDEVFMAVADCTGHGVPGAIMSVICCNALNEVVINKGITDTGQVLDQVRDIVIRTLKSSRDGNQKDGMDIVLVKINRVTGSAQFSGANNPLWIIPASDSALVTELKADKQPVGMHTALNPFTSHSFQLNKGDGVYLFSDGYADQFGGPKGKKFKYSTLKELLVETFALTPDEQVKVLEEKFTTWRGELEQVDDVCVIGIRI
ncbi:MAG: 7TM diverse intracellular signaling domain-containing protein [Flavobacteriales bacterium]